MYASKFLQLPTEVLYYVDQFFLLLANKPTRNPECGFLDSICRVYPIYHCPVPYSYLICLFASWNSSPLLSKSNVGKSPRLKSVCYSVSDPIDPEKGRLPVCFFQINTCPCQPGKFLLSLGWADWHFWCCWPPTCLVVQSPLNII